MVDWILACSTTSLVAFLPGGIVLGLMVPAVRSEVMIWLAAAPPVSIGLLFAVSQGLTLLGLSATPLAQLLVLGTAVATYVVSKRARGAVDQEPARIGNSTVDRHCGSIAAALLFMAMAIGLIVWTIALHGQPRNPPSRDGEYHGYFVMRIVETGSVDPATVITTDPVTEEPAASYYPLGMHNAVALQHRTVGLGIGLLLTSWVVVCSAIVLPAGLFALVRRLVPTRPLAAGFTSLVAPFFAMFPYGPAAWSAISLIVGMAFVPVTIVLVGRAGDAVRDRWRLIVVAATAAFGVLSTHTSQVGLLAMWLAFLTVADGYRERSSPVAIRRRATNVVGVGICTLVLYLPALWTLRSAAAERSAFSEQPFTTMAQAIGSMAMLSYAVPAGQGLLAILVVAGLWLAARDRHLGGWAACLVGAMLMFLATAVIGGPISALRPLTQIWYYGSWRTSYNVALAMMVFGGYALAGVAQSAARVRGVVRPPHASLAGTAVITIAFVGVGAVSLLGQPVDIVRNAYATNSPASGGQLEAFQYLDSHVPEGRPVLNEERDGSTWMYAEHGLLPLLGVYRYEPSAQSDDRIYLATHVADYATDARVRALVARWDIDYLLVNETGFVDEPPRVAPDDLVGRPDFTEVFASGGSHVYRINR